MATSICKRFSASLSIMKMQYNKISLHIFSTAIIRNNPKSSVFEDMEKLECLDTVGGNTKWYTH